MKGAHKGSERQEERPLYATMSLYEQTLNKLVQATGDGKTYRDDQENLFLG